MIKIKKNKIFYVVSALLVALPFLYTNCGKSLKSVTTGQNSVMSVEDVANKSDVKNYEVINSRQYLQSYMNLLDLKREEITVAADFNKMLAEVRIRAPLLPGKNNINETNEISIISQVSLAGAVCDIYIKLKGATSPYFKNRINFSKKLNEIEDEKWLEAWSSMFQDIHGRKPSSVETGIIQKFFNENKTEYTTATVKDMRFTHNTGVLLCTSILASLESASF